MNDKLVQQTEAFLKRCFDSGRFLSERPEEKAYRLEHTYRVANLGREIARREGMDETELVIACLLHDLSYGEGFGEKDWKDHGRCSAALACRNAASAVATGRHATCTTSTTSLGTTT